MGCCSEKRATISFCNEACGEILMLRLTQTGFVAYPAGQILVQDAINGAAERSKSTHLHLTPWSQLSTIGLKLDNLIRDKIADSDVLLADVTFPNFNVFYEIGYAIAVEKPFVPMVNISVESAQRSINEIGFFDTTGWLSYTNSNEITKALDNWEPIAWTNKLRRKRDHSAPLFILDSRTKSDFRNYVFNAATSSKVNFRSYDPVETSRFTIAQAISDVSASTGIILPLQDPQLVGSKNNNLRAAFLAGLAHGYGLNPMIIQYDNSPAPFDFRDFITNTASRTETDRHIGGYCQQTLIDNQNFAQRPDRVEVSLLNRIDLGAAAAENESRQLEHYFIPTSAYARAKRAEGALVIGRKGSGKSAICFRLIDEEGRNPRKLCVELKPSAHNLSELRENLREAVSDGIYDHTMGAFWHYIIYTELLLRVREEALLQSTRDMRLQSRLADVEDRFGLNNELVSGDFTFRLVFAVKQILEYLHGTPDPDKIKGGLTNLLYESSIPLLREALISFRDICDSLVIVIDDLDKGWPARQIEDYDVRTIKHLVEVLHRIQRDLRKKDYEFKFILALRSDVYENLVQQTPDRGKYNAIPVDWSDPDQLRHMLKQRVLTSFEGDEAFEAWGMLNTNILPGRDSVSLMIESSLYRPRFLIEAAERVVAFAINRGHTVVVRDDVENGLNQMSMYLVSEFGFEMRDVAGTPERIFYAFIGCEPELSYEQVAAKISNQFADLDTKKTIQMLLWYGFLGTRNKEGEAVFIFDRAYDFNRLLAELSVPFESNVFVVNAAFLRGLKVN